MQLSVYDKYILNYAIFCYGGSYTVEGNFLRMFIDTDEFYVNLTDKHRFGKYQVMHRNSQRHTDGVIRFHQQLYAKELSYAIFVCYTHLFNKRLNILNSPEDFFYFKKDAYIYKM